MTASPVGPLPVAVADLVFEVGATAAAVPDVVTQVIFCEFTSARLSTSKRTFDATS